MLFKALVVYASFAVALAAPFQNYTRCSNQHNSTQLQALEAQYTQDLAVAEASGRLHRAKADTTTTEGSSLASNFCRTIKVAWHIIYESETVQGGYMKDKAVQDSINALNAHYKGSEFRFVLDRTTRTKSKDWFNKVDVYTPEQDAMKKQLHVGDAGTLNVYTVNIPGGTLGFSPYPQSYASAPWDDGVVIKHSSVPGGAATGFNEGKTLTHEVGHWLGLLHVFNEQGRCTEQDMVSDTPVQATSTEGCPSSKDSCPNLPGKDAIHNYMDYSTDVCMTEFTPGQIARMQTQSDLYRKVARLQCASPLITPALSLFPTLPLSSLEPVHTAIVTPVIPPTPVIPAPGPGPDPAPWE